jgi:hypothetical protein
VNPSQEPASPHRPDHPPVDPTAAPIDPTGAVGAGPARDDSTGPGPASPWAKPSEPDPAASDPGFVEGGYGLAHPTGPDEPYGLEGYADAWEEPRPNPRPWRRTLLVAALTGVVVLVLGAPLGLIWHWLAPSVPVLDAGSNGIVVNDPSPEEYIAADGWYTMLGLGFGLVVAIVAWLVMRKDRGPYLLLGVVLGTFGAGYLVGPWIGGLIGRGGYHHWEQTAVQGATYLAPPQVHSVGPRLVAAFAAAIVLTLLAGWSNDPDLDAPGAKPGYGSNAQPGPEPAVPELNGSELNSSETGA